MVPADADLGLGAYATGGRGSARPPPLAPRGCVGLGCARAAPALPCLYLCRCLRRTSYGRGRRAGASSSATQSRRRPRPRLTMRRPPRPAGRPHADWQVSACVPAWPRSPGCPSRARPGGAVAPHRSHPGLARRNGYGQDAPKHRPQRRPIRRRTNPPRTPLLGRDLPGRDLPGFAGGSTVSPRTRRRPRVTCRRWPRRTSPGPASAWRVPGPFRVLSLLRVLSPVLALSHERASHSSARAPAAPQVRARGRGSLVHPTGRSAVGRSGGARSQPAPVAARLRSLDPSVTPFARSEGANRIQGQRVRGLA